MGENYRIVPDNATFGMNPEVEPVDWCWAPLERQPDVSCYRRAGHDGPHEDIVCPPCPTCGGLEEHTQECPDPDHTYAAFESVQIQWDTEA